MIHGPGAPGVVQKALPTTKRQQNRLVHLMKSYSPPHANPRSGVSMEYNDHFWEQAATELNGIESDPRQYRDKNKWRQIWKNHSTKVRKKKELKQPLTIFEEQVAVVLQLHSSKESNTYLEDDNNEEITVSPDIDETGLSCEAEEPDRRPAKIQNNRRKTVGFVEQASIDQARSSIERSRMSKYRNQMNANNEPVPSTSRQNLDSYDDLVLINPIKIETRSFEREQMSFNRFKPNPSPSLASTIILEPRPSHQETGRIKIELDASPTGSSTYQRCGNSSSDNFNRQRDEINRRLSEANQMGQRLAKDLESYNRRLSEANQMGQRLAKDLESYNLMIRSISETFQHYSGLDQENSSSSRRNGRECQKQSETASTNIIDLTL